LKRYIEKIVDRQDLSYEEASNAMDEIMSGTATNSQIAAFLTALRMKGETSDEIASFSRKMRDYCHKIDPKIEGRLVDTCGTGGDKIKTFNISTTASFVVAGAGIAVAKHGNRSFTSKSGSADVLESLGINLDMSPKAVEKSIANAGIGFMFAPSFHPAMKHAVDPRRDIGIRTVFNILGPLTNPANADSQILGVYDKKLINPLTQSLNKLGRREAMVFHGLDGLDEISTLGKTTLAWLKEGEIDSLTLTPKKLGVKKASLNDIRGFDPEKNAEITFKILTGKCDKKDAKREIVIVNASAGIIVGGKAENFDEGKEIACESIDSGEAYRRLKMLIKESKGDISKLERLESEHG
jgi:anthranilate phosphoribosyltransferase